MYEHHVTSTKSAVSIASIHTTFFRLLSHVESISKMAQKFTCVSSRHIKNPNYGEGRSSTSRPFFFGFLFGRSRRIEIRRKISIRSLIKLPFLSVRPTFLPSCTFNLTWPFRSKRLIFFIIWCLLISCLISHSLQASIRFSSFSFASRYQIRMAYEEARGGTCEKAVHILIIACEESMDSQPTFSVAWGFRSVEAIHIQLQWIRMITHGEVRVKAV